MGEEGFEDSLIEFRSFKVGGVMGYMPRYKEMAT